MNIDAFLRNRSDEWQELSALMAKSSGKLSKLDSQSIMRFGHLYRATCADLAFARREYAGDAVHYNLETMVSTCSSMLYRHRATDKNKVLYFITTGAFASIAQRPKLILASFLLLMVPWIASSIYANVNPANAVGLAPAGVESVVERPSADFELSAGQKDEASSAITTGAERSPSTPTWTRSAPTPRRPTQSSPARGNRSAPAIPASVSISPANSRTSRKAWRR